MPEKGTFGGNRLFCRNFQQTFNKTLSGMELVLLRKQFSDSENSGKPSRMQDLGEHSSELRIALWLPPIKQFRRAFV